MTTDLLILADRVEGLSGPDRALDILILTAVAGYRDIHGDGTLFDRGNDGYWTLDGDEKNPPLPSPTGSLDTAMQLVPEGLRLMLSEWDDEKHLRPRGPWQAVLSLPGADASFDLMRGYRCEHAATPAIAITAACLRARTIAANQENPS